ncbi:MAG: DsbA family protein [Chloroflexi bacterium]|nr:DsbA family protein [Chloroflexota bacterium]
MATKRNFYIALGVVVTLVVIAAIYLILDQPPQVDAARLALDPVIGEVDAPVTIYQFGAYGCYSCRATHQSGFNAQLEELIATEYAGQVKFVFVNFPVISANDPLSAEAAQCALDQGQEVFWSFHNSLFVVSNETYAQMRGEDDYVEFAERIGIDADALDECLDNDTHERTVDHHEQRANRLNVPGTAIFYVNDRQVQPDIDAIRELIDTELAN